MKPYIYRTDDYGANWTLLTDGKNGIPSDFPTRVVREDPAREGLLYAGTEFSAFVSFNNGRNWQSLQQNLPAAPVTDIRVHRNDLVISTMGRSLWIMDNVTPLQQLAALIGGPRGTSNPVAARAVSVRTEDISGPSAAEQPAAGTQPLPPRFTSSSLAKPSISALGQFGRRGRSECSSPGVHIDLWFQSAPPADTQLESSTRRNR